MPKTIDTVWTKWAPDCGLKVAQGLTITVAWYWDKDDASRAFAKRFAEKNNGVPPTYTQAGVYSEVAHYLKAVKAIGSFDVLRGIQREVPQLRMA